MKCPKCGAAASDGAAECPACGVIFAKLQELKAREKREVDETLQLLEKGEPDGSPPALHPRTGRIVAGVIIVLWVVGFGLYYRSVVLEARRRALEGGARGRLVPLPPAPSKKP